MHELSIIGKTAIVDPVILNVFAEFLRLDVANGDASPDTIRGYWGEVAHWVRWCQERGIDPARATVADVKAFRQDLVSLGYKPASIARKLAVLRRFYEAARAAGMRSDNPAAGVRPPKTRTAADDFQYLTEVELALLLRAVPRGTHEKARRDRCIVALLALQGLRTVEITRGNVDDLEQRGDYWALRAHGKNHDRLVYLRHDVADALNAYLAARKEPMADAQGIPLFTAVGNRAGGRRISRRGVRQVVDFYLRKADLKKPGLSDHALRHTAATMAYKYSHDLRAVQEMLGHSDPRTTARYAHVLDRERNNPAAAVPVSLEADK